MERWRRIATLLTLPGLLLFAAGCADEDTEPNGPSDSIRGTSLYGEVTGSLSGVYTVSDSIVVPAGQSLTVQAGTEMFFMPGAKFIVHGEIQAQGTVTNWIHFTSNRSQPDRGDWDGLWLLDADDTSLLEYVRISFAAKYNLIEDTTREYLDDDRAIIPDNIHRGAITVLRCSPTIRRNIIEFGGYDGIQVIGKSEPVIEHNTIVNNAFNGIRIEPDWSVADIDTLDRTVAPSNIFNNLIVENDDAGIRLHESPDLYNVGMIPDLSYNNIWNNASLDYVPPGFRVAADVSRDIHVNPVFVDVEGGDYNLHPCSGVIDRGDPDETDPDGTRADIGALTIAQGPYDLAKQLTADGAFDKLNLEAGEVYRVRCDAWVAEGDVLSIEPGTVLAFEGRYSLRIYGGLQVSGEPGSEVVFTSAFDEPERSDWKQIVLDHASDDSFIEHAIVEYASMENQSSPDPDTLGALSLIASSPVISELTIRECYYVGLYCFDGASPVVDRLTVENVGMHGISCELNSSPTITRTTIHDAGGYGVSMSKSSPTIANMLMYNLGTAGFLVQEFSSPTINYTTVYGRRSEQIGGEEPVTRRIAQGVRAKDRAQPLLMNSIISEYATVGVQSQFSSLPDLRYVFLYSEAGADPVSGNVDSLMVHEQDPRFVNPDEFNFRLSADSPAKDASENGGEVGAYGGDGM
ncbi:MAG: hypothetical protein MAG453_00007 [Calditrichaeota bacterium]|nr:hypothetical protein [Calditrichota bacterium]